MSPTEKRRDDKERKEERPERERTAAEQHVEDELDEALEETFPASDPPASTQPHPRKRRQED